MTLTPTEIEQLRIAIAEECGWTRIIKSERYKVVPMGIRPNYPDYPNPATFEIPPYTTSLDAIQAAAMERFKTKDDQRHFQLALKQLPSDAYCDWQLTALDWCIAFARTAKIWRYKP